MKKSVLKNFTKFTGKHLCQSLNFIKKETLVQVFSSEFCEISNNIFSTEHLWTTASGVLITDCELISFTFLFCFIMLVGTQATCFDRCGLFFERTAGFWESLLLLAKRILIFTVILTTTFKHMKSWGKYWISKFWVKKTIDKRFYESRTIS